MNCPGQGGSCRVAGTCSGVERGWSSPVPAAWMGTARLLASAPRHCKRWGSRDSHNQ